MRRALRLFVVLLLSSAMLSSAGAAEIFPRIINGIPAIEFSGGEFQEQFSAVGIVGSEQFGGFCSGTLITPVHVLTAAHCADVIESQTAGRFQVGGEVYSTVRIHIHERFNPRTLANDIAILELSEPVENVVPAQIFRGTPRVDDPLIIVGYGAGGDADTGSDGSFGNLMAGVTTIDVVDATLITWEYDDPDEANTAPGDSGGPGFRDDNGTLRIVCITSGGTRQDASLGDIAFNTRVDAYARWIDDIVGTETEPPPEEPDPPQEEENDPLPEETDPPQDEDGDPPDDGTGGEEPGTDDESGEDCPQSNRPGQHGHRPGQHGHRPGQHGHRPGQHGHRPGPNRRPGWHRPWQAPRPLVRPARRPARRPAVVPTRRGSVGTRRRTSRSPNARSRSATRRGRVKPRTRPDV